MKQAHALTTNGLAGTAIAAAMLAANAIVEIAAMGHHANNRTNVILTSSMLGFLALTVAGFAMLVTDEIRKTADPIDRIPIHVARLAMAGSSTALAAIAVALAFAPSPIQAAGRMSGRHCATARTVGEPMKEAHVVRR